MLPPPSPASRPVRDGIFNYRVPTGHIERVYELFSTNILSLTGHFNQHFIVDTTLC